MDWVNDPRLIARERRMAPVNATTEVDLYGQCGVGDDRRAVLVRQRRPGRLRARRGAVGGRRRVRRAAIIDHVVTEHGVALLRGRTLAQRAAALIAITDPAHRDALTADGGHSASCAPLTAAAASNGPLTGGAVLRRRRAPPHPHFATDRLRRTTQ